MPVPDAAGTYTPRDSGIAIGDNEEDFTSIMALLTIAPVPKDFLLLRSASCPTCKGDLRLEADGKATLTKGGVKKTFTVDPERMGMLVAKLTHYRFFEMADEYGAGAPTTIITVTMNGQTKKVAHHIGDVMRPAKDASDPFEGPRLRVFDVESAISTTIEFVDGGLRK